MASRVVTSVPGAARRSKSACMQPHVLGLVHGQPVLGPVEARGQLRGRDAELVRVLLDVERHQLRAVARLAALPRPLERPRRDHLRQDPHEQRVAGHVRVVGALRQVAARTSRSSVSRSVSGLSPVTRTTCVGADARARSRCGGAARRPRRRGRRGRPAVAPPPPARRSPGSSRWRAPRRPSPRAAAHALEQHLQQRPAGERRQRLARDSARRPCAARRPRPEWRRSLQHVLADRLVRLDGPAGAPADHAVRLARREAGLEALVGALEGEHLRRAARRRA